MVGYGRQSPKLQQLLNDTKLIDRKWNDGLKYVAGIVQLAWKTGVHKNHEIRLGANDNNYNAKFSIAIDKGRTFIGT
jgi:hypothetical protein